MTVLSNASAVLANATSPRGVKRSRSPESYGDLSRTGEGEGEDGASGVFGDPLDVWHGLTRASTLYR